MLGHRHDSRDGPPVTGLSGRGKSTLLLMLAGLGPPTSGTIVYNGAPVTGPAADRSLIFQQPSLYPWLSAPDNVAFGWMLRGVGRKERRQRAEVTKAFREQELAEMLDTRIT
jgi:ABC-type taurine transport system ATPase subunit